MSDVRFDHVWESWDAARAAPAGRRTFIREATTDDLIALLASRVGRGREEDRNAIATALLNRIRESHVHDPTLADRTNDIINTSGRLSRRGREVILQTRAMLAEGRKR